MSKFQVGDRVKLLVPITHIVYYDYLLLFLNFAARKGPMIVTSVDGNKIGLNVEDGIFSLIEPEKTEFHSDRTRRDDDEISGKVPCWDESKFELVESAFDKQAKEILDESI